MGRRKPFVAVGAPGLAVTGFLLFVPNWFLDLTNPNLGLLLFFYYLATLCTFKFFYAFLLTAFQAWLPEITDEDERPLVSSMQNTANWIANGLGVVVSFLTTLLFYEDPEPPGLKSFGVMFILAFSVLTVVFFLPSIILIREKPDIVVPRRSLTQETAIALANHNYVGWMFAVGFLSFTFSAITAQIVGVTRDVLLLNSLPLLLPPALSLLISIMVFLFVWIKVIRSIGKKRSMTISMIVLALLLPMTVILQSLMVIVPNVIVGVVYFIPLAACMAVYYLMSYIVPADIAQVDEIETGQSRSGIYTGFIGVPLNFFQAASAVILGVMMDYSKPWALIWWGPIFAPALIVAVIILRYIDIDPDFKTLWARKTGA